MADVHMETRLGRAEHYRAPDLALMVVLILAWESLSAMRQLYRREEGLMMAYMGMIPCREGESLVGLVCYWGFSLFLLLSQEAYLHPI